MKRTAPRARKTAPFGFRARSGVACAAALLAVFLATPASARCVSLLMAAPTDNEPELALTDCDVQGRLQPDTAGVSVILVLQEPSLSRWRAALDREGTQARALLTATLRLFNTAATLPGGLLISSHSARMIREPHWIWDSQAGALRWAPSGTRPALAACPRGVGTPVLWIEPLEVRPGGLIASDPARAVRPGTMSAIPTNCVTGWELSAGAPAAIHPTLGLVVVAGNAPDGTIFSVHAMVGDEAMKGLVRVTDPKLHLLAGRWRQTLEQACGTAGRRVPLHPVGELIFTAAGGFTLTRQPFESYRDYWGTYRYDRQTGVLSLDTTGGNRLPAKRTAELQARIDGVGELTITGLDPGDGTLATPSCTMVFQRD